MKNKGFTLIELLITLSLVSSLLIIETKSICKCNIIYKQLIKEFKDELYINEAFNFLYSKIDNCLEIDVEDNKIIIKNEHEKEVIRQYEDALIINYFEENNIHNNIIKGISGFKVCKKGNVMFVTIERKNNKKYIRSFSMK